MPAQYANLGGRRFVNEDFVEEVRRLYPVTTKKIPLGFSTYVGWTGKDEVLFTSHDRVGGLEGKVYEVTFDPSNPGAFDEGILAEIDHTTKTASLELTRVWGPTLLDMQALAKKARAPSGLYGFAKSVQASCEAAARKLNRRAADLVRRAAQKDPAVVPFLQTHSTRGPSLSAQALLGAYTASLPRVAQDGISKAAGPVKLGMYGFPAKIASLGLASCTALREEAGMLAADLHARRAKIYAKITGFLQEHSKTAGCSASGLLLSCYPEEGFTFRRASEDWVAWEA